MTKSVKIIVTIVVFLVYGIIAGAQKRASGGAGTFFTVIAVIIFYAIWNTDNSDSNKQNFDNFPIDDTTSDNREIHFETITNTPTETNNLIENKTLDYNSVILEFTKFTHIIYGNESNNIQFANNKIVITNDKIIVNNNLNFKINRRVCSQSNGNTLFVCSHDTNVFLNKNGTVEITTRTKGNNGIKYMK